MTDEYVSRCPACGEPIDYCQGHGEVGDPHGRAILDAHDAGDHSGCHPEGCDELRDEYLEDEPVAPRCPAIGPDRLNNHRCDLPAGHGEPEHSAIIAGEWVTWQDGATTAETFGPVVLPDGRPAPFTVAILTGTQPGAMARADAVTRAWLRRDEPPPPLIDGTPSSCIAPGDDDPHAYFVTLDLVPFRHGPQTVALLTTRCDDGHEANVELSLGELGQLAERLAAIVAATDPADTWEEPIEEPPPPARCRRCGDELDRDAFGLCGRCLDNS